MSPWSLEVTAQDQYDIYWNRQRCAVGHSKFGYLKPFFQYPRPFPKWNPIRSAAAAGGAGGDRVADLLLNTSLDVRTSHAACTDAFGSVGAEAFPSAL